MDASDTPIQPSASIIEKHLGVLKRQFVVSLEKREQDLEDAISSLAAYGSQKDPLAALYYLAHNISGVAPTYGLTDLAAEARSLEAMLAKTVLPPHRSADLERVLLAADDLGEAIRAEMHAS